MKKMRFGAFLAGLSLLVLMMQPVSASGLSAPAGASEHNAAVSVRAEPPPHEGDENWCRFKGTKLLKAGAGKKAIRYVMQCEKRFKLLYIAAIVARTDGKGKEYYGTARCYDVATCVTTVVIPDPRGTVRWAALWEPGNQGPMATDLGKATDFYCNALTGDDDRGIACTRVVFRV